MRIAILGAGLAGLSIGHLLAAEGHELVIADAAAEPAMGASFANGGHIATADAHSWASRRAVLSMLASLFRRDQSFSFAPALSLAQWRFITAFLARTRPAAQKDAASKLMQFSLYSKACLQENSPPFPHWDGQQTGTLHLYRRASALNRAERHAAMLQQQYGVKTESISRARLPELEPSLNAALFCGGIFYPDDITGNARKYALCLAKDLQDSLRLNTRIISAHCRGQIIHAVRTASGEEIAADMFVLALGNGSSPFAASLPPEICPHLPVYPVGGYSLTAPAPKQNLRLGLLDEEKRMVYTPLGNSVRVAGFAHIGGQEVRLNPSRAALMLNIARETAPQILPQTLNEEVKVWAGARPMTPDGMPIIGFASRKSNLLLAAGFGSLGWTLCHGAAKIVASLVAGTKPDYNSSGFSVERFG